MRRLTRTGGQKNAFGCDGFLGRRSARDSARHRNGSHHERSWREPGRRVVVERNQKARGVRGGHLLTRSSSSSPSRSIGKNRPVSAVCVRVQIRALIVFMFGLCLNRQNQRAIRPERRSSQLPAASFTARDGYVHPGDPAAALASMSTAPRWRPR